MDGVKKESLGSVKQRHKVELKEWEKRKKDLCNGEMRDCYGVFRSWS